LTFNFIGAQMWWQAEDQYMKILDKSSSKRPWPILKKEKKNRWCIKCSNLAVWVAT